MVQKLENVVIMSLEEYNKIVGEQSVKKELVVGKWYKLNGNLYYITRVDEKYYYGYVISADSKWYDECRVINISGKEPAEATTQEVEEALIKEAKKRGFTPFYEKFHFEPGFNILYDRFGLGAEIIFKDGQWAEVIKPEEKPIQKAIAIRKDCFIVGEVTEQTETTVSISHLLFLKDQVTFLSEEEYQQHRKESKND